ncbi:Mut7-C RNAse domain-containing protein [Naasia sp. SYSU D00057]|uniref:Mut7-C RNAse domain-containing protein n=1 Tax=Naasia sp. SYSU D00057 TaxID=2817380 RepID=UPI001B30E589|nr:Mut7-C RNAse domain-containing protein [Naasia sp. SYSU D00057]
MPRLAVDIDPELTFLLPRGRRRSPLEVDAGATDTAGHIVQSLGIPLTEVGELRLDDRLIPRAEQRRAPIGSAALLAVHRRPRPQPHAGRFLLDVHLAALARRMRLLGIDTAYEPDADDGRLADWAAREQRVLLTRDVALLSRAVVPDGALLVHDDVADQLDDVLDRFAPALAPWTRCLVCGEALGAVAAEDVASEVEPGTLRTYRDFARCTGCGRVYWRGAHSRRLEGIVEHARDRVRRSSTAEGGGEALG